jgi:hypothetical protein
LDEDWEAEERGVFVIIPHLHFLLLLFSDSWRGFALAYFFLGIGLLGII